MDQLIPDGVVFVIAERPLHRKQEFVGIEIREGQAVALFAVLIEGLYRILESSRFPDDGN